MCVNVRSSCKSRAEIEEWCVCVHARASVCMAKHACRRFICDRCGVWRRWKLYALRVDILDASPNPPIALSCDPGPVIEPVKAGQWWSRHYI